MPETVVQLGPNGALIGGILMASAAEKTKVVEELLLMFDDLSKPSNLLLKVSVVSDDPMLVKTLLKNDC